MGGGSEEGWFSLNIRLENSHAALWWKIVTAHKCKDTEEQTGKNMIVIFTQLLHCWDTNYHHRNVIWDQQQPLGVRRDEGAEWSDLLGWCKWQSSAPLGELGVLHYWAERAVQVARAWPWGTWEQPGPRVSHANPTDARWNISVFDSSSWQRAGLHWKLI